jgi:DNA-binding NarL/FixJ family response regulator
MEFLNPPLRLVLVDGSAIVRAGIKRRLAEVPEICLVEECEDVHAAVAAIRTHEPDLVIMDFRMEGGLALDVLQVCRSIRPRPISIVYTLETNPATRAMSYASGADIFFDKSRDMGPLMAMLKQLAATLLEHEAIPS